MMPTPPVVRLSQALYTDVPTSSPVRPSPRSASRKRGHAHVAGRAFERRSTRPATGIRLLLPRTFAVADRAYHAPDFIAAAEPAAAVGGAARDQVPARVDCTCSGEDAALEQQHLPLKNACPERTNCGSSSSGGTAALTTFHGSRQQYSDRLAATEGGGKSVVVVESVLGFSAVRALLERSYRPVVPRSGYDQGDQESQKQCCRCAGGAEVGRDGDGGGMPGVGSSDEGVSEAVRRLIGWLRIAGTSAALGADGSGKQGQHNHGRGGRSGILVGLTGKQCDATTSDAGERTLLARGERRGRRATVAAADDDDLYDVLYEVTERCEGGREWSAFTLEPAPSRTTGRGQLSGTRGDTYLARKMREIRLICHPLVTMAPDIRWCLRLIGQAKAIAGLLNANAKLSTLGGGYFLTRQVGQAIRLARAQSEVATALGDVQLAGKCRINEAYNYIWLGQYAEAQRIIHAQVNASRAVHDEELEAMAAIAARFLTRSKKANRRLLKSQVDASGGGGHSSGDQQWVQQQIDVKTDEWHRVRALPMYCSSSSRRAPVSWEETNRAQPGLLQM